MAGSEGGNSRDGRDEHLDEVWTVANVITVLRLLLIPFFFSVVLSEREHADILAFALFAGAALTDWLDGMIARRTGTVTTVGKIIDPLVDRLLLAAGVVGLYLIGRAPLWLVGILVARDAYLLWGAYRLERHGERMPVTRLGKLTTAVLLAGFSLLILGWPKITWGGLDYLGQPVVMFGLVLSLVSAAHYTLLAKRLVVGRVRPDR